MWIYETKLHYPVKIKNPNPKLAGVIISQLGGPDGETGAALRYLNQRYTMPSAEAIGVLTDIGSEELGHQEMVAAILYQLTKGLTPAEIKAGGFDKYFVDHTLGIYPTSAAGMPYTAASMQSKGDAVADLMEDLAADAAIPQAQSLSKDRRKPLRNKDFSYLGKRRNFYHLAIT